MSYGLMPYGLMSYGPMALCPVVLCPMVLESYVLWSCVLWSTVLCPMHGPRVLCPMVLCPMVLCPVLYPMAILSYCHPMVLQLYVLLLYSLVSLQSYVLGNINIQSHGTGVLYHGATSGTTVAKEVCWRPYPAP